MEALLAYWLAVRVNWEQQCSRGGETLVLRSPIIAVLVMDPIRAIAQAPRPAVASAAEELLTRCHVEALAAVIALYPNALVAEFPMAQTPLSDGASESCGFSY